MQGEHDTIAQAHHSHPDASSIKRLNARERQEISQPKRSIPETVVKKSRRASRDAVSDGLFARGSKLAPEMRETVKNV